MTGPTNGDPQISVIVLAHNRVQYLRGAVESVVRQDLDRSKFEVVVVKNYEDAALESYFREVGATSIICTEQPGALKVAAGVARSRGRILLVLDDDDLFEPSRLRTIAAYFDSRGDLGFYGNRASFIGPKGEFLDLRSVPRFGSGPSRSKGTLFLASSKTAESLRQLAFRHPDFNVSSSAVRRELVERSLPYLKRLIATVDTLFFFSALVSEYSVLLDDALLTRYRIHEDNTSLAGSGLAEARSKKMLEFAQLAERDYRVIREFVASSGNAQVLRLMDARLLLVQLIEACRDPASRRRDFAAPLRGLLRYRDTYPVRESLPTILAGILCLVAPSIGRAAYRKQIRVD